MTAKDILKGWFSTGKKPTGPQFAEWMDSFRHKEDKIAIAEVEKLSEVLGGKEPAIKSKGSAFNKDFGTAAGQVMEGNDERVAKGVRYVDGQLVAPDGNAISVGGGGNVNTVNDELPDGNKNVVISAEHIDAAVSDAAWWGTSSLKIKGALDYLANKIKQNTSSLNSVSFHISFTQLDTRARLNLDRKVRLQPLKSTGIIRSGTSAALPTVQVIAYGYTGPARISISDVNADILALTPEQASAGYVLQILVKLVQGESFGDAILKGEYYA